METIFQIRNTLGFPVGIFSPIGISKVWQNGKMRYFIPEGKEAEPFDVLPMESIDTNNLPVLDGVDWLVDDAVKAANPSRNDLVSMLNVLTDCHGKICGCLAFV